MPPRSSAQSFPGPRGPVSFRALGSACSPPSCWAPGGFCSGHVCKLRAGVGARIPPSGDGGLPVCVLVGLLCECAQPRAKGIVVCKSGHKSGQGGKSLWTQAPGFGWASWAGGPRRRGRGPREAKPVGGWGPRAPAGGKLGPLSRGAACSNSPAGTAPGHRCPHSADRAAPMGPPPSPGVHTEGGALPARPLSPSLQSQTWGALKSSCRGGRKAHPSRRPRPLTQGSAWTVPGSPAARRLCGRRWHAAWPRASVWPSLGCDGSPAARGADVSAKGL